MTCEQSSESVHRSRICDIGLGRVINMFFIVCVVQVRSTWSRVVLCWWKWMIFRAYTKGNVDDAATRDAQHFVPVESCLIAQMVLQHMLPRLLTLNLSFFSFPLFICLDLSHHISLAQGPSSISISVHFSIVFLSLNTMNRSVPSLLSFSFSISINRIYHFRYALDFHWWHSTTNQTDTTQTTHWHTRTSHAFTQTQAVRQSSTRSNQSIQLAVIDNDSQSLHRA